MRNSIFSIGLVASSLGLFIGLDLVADSSVAAAEESNVIESPTNTTLEKIRLELEAMAKTGGMIQEPKTFVEYYHNAIMLASIGNNLEALKAFEAALRLNNNFADPIIRTEKLAHAVFGADAADAYLEKRIRPVLSEETAQLITVLQNRDRPAALSEDVIAGRLDYVPALAKWHFDMLGKTQNDMRSQKAYAISAHRVYLSYTSGEFQKYFISKTDTIDHVDRIEAFYQSVVQYCDSFDYCDEVKKASE